MLLKLFTPTGWKPNMYKGAFGVWGLRGQSVVLRSGTKSYALGDKWKRPRKSTWKPGFCLTWLAFSRATAEKCPNVRK